MDSYISSVQKQFRYYKSLADGAITQLSDTQLFQKLNRDEDTIQTNSVAIIVQHMAGNMVSRWTNIYDEDGEKEWRNRDREFEEPKLDRTDLIAYWEQGWDALFAVVDHLQNDDLERIIYIRNMGHSLIEAINRQLMHYAYHIGQIVLLSKEWKGNAWKSLSIPLGESNPYNDAKFARVPQRKHFTDDEMNT